jgi:hypothetical protein
VDPPDIYFRSVTPKNSVVTTPANYWLCIGNVTEFTFVSDAYLVVIILQADPSGRAV